MKKKKRIHSTIILFFIIFGVRCVQALIIQSYFVADEYWQSLEIAHKFVFDYGFITWEWKEGIRSFIFPSIFIYLYKILQITHIDFPFILRFAPRLIMCIIQAFQDLFVFKESGMRGLIIFIFLWPTSYIGTRTLSNSLESLLFILLYVFKAPVFLIVISFWVRPTTIFASIFFFFYFYKHEITIKRIIEGIFSVILCSSYDAIFYYKMGLNIPICTPYNFFKRNLLNNVAVFYGSQPFLFYFYSCIPSLLGPLLLTFYKCYKEKFFIFSMLFVLFNSFISHKEIRYVYPILPFITVACSKYVSTELLIFNSIIHFIAMMFLGQFHQIGQGTITNFISRDPIETMFLLPCHSTPFYSHVHHKIPMSFLECPNNGYNPSKEFIQNPSDFVNIITPVKQIVTYSSFADNITKWLHQNNYSQIYSKFNTFFFIDDINASYITVYRRG